MTASHRGSQRLSGAHEVGKAAAKGLDAEQSLLIGERMIRLNRNNNPQLSECEGRMGKAFYHGCSMG
jgi:hypothetical protein